MYSKFIFRIFSFIHLSLKKRSNYNKKFIDENSSDLNINNIDLIEKQYTYHKSKYFIIKFISMLFSYTLGSLSFVIFYQIRKDSNHYNISHKFQKDIINQLDILARYILSIIFLKEKLLSIINFR